jgi:hypothetical protein
MMFQKTAPSVHQVILHRLAAQKETLTAAIRNLRLQLFEPHALLGGASHLVYSIIPPLIYGISMNIPTYYIWDGIWGL